MSRLNMIDARCTALFASGLPRSEALTGDAVAEAVRRAVRRYGVRGCAARMAQEFGDHPEMAVDRMRWIRQLVGEMPARPARFVSPPAGCAQHFLEDARAVPTTTPATAGVNRNEHGSQRLLQDGFQVAVAQGDGIALHAA